VWRRRLDRGILFGQPQEPAMPESRYAVTVEVRSPFAETIERVTALLAQQGFGVLSTIDVQQTLKSKIGAEIPPYTILGACNPGFAHQAIQAIDDIGVLLPCNVVVTEPEPGRCAVHLTRVDGMFSLVDAPAAAGIADEVGRRLDAVAAALRR
jgi:uncharacterized protein (DUF302 family)